MKKIVFFLSVFFAFESLVIAQQITRGPYLQMGTPTGMVVRWRTDVPVVGKVHFGTELNNLQYETEGFSTTEHEIKISGLSPNTIYYYNIATPSSVLLSADAQMYFKTSPVPGAKQPLRAWVIGDFGNGSQGQLDVMNSYLNYTGSAHTDVWLWLGDNAYGDGTQQEYQTKVFEVYTAPFKKMVAWPCPGNHDYKSINLSNQGPYYDIFTMPTNGEAGGKPSGTEGYYSYDYGNAHFISLNSEYLLWTLNDDTDMAKWLKEDLAQNDKDWTIAYWHQPPYSRGSHDSDDGFSRMEMLRQYFNPILEEHGVDLVLTGHSHGYERSYMIKGHFGKSNTFNPATMIVDSVYPFTKYVDGDRPNEGTVYAVVGCSGQLSSSGSMDHPANQISINAYNGSLVIDIDGLTLSAKFLTAKDGIKDSFTIQKISVADTVSGTGIAKQIGKMSVMPNPVKDAFSVRFDMKNLSNATLSLLNIQGEKVGELYRGNIATGERLTFSTNDYPSGIYILQLSGEGFSQTVKFVLSK